MGKEYFCGARQSWVPFHKRRFAGGIFDETGRGFSLPGWKAAGLRSFVLQKSQEKSREKEQEGGLLADLIKQIKAACPDCAVTLAAGIYPEETVHMWRQAGADRYLVRLERSEAAGRAGDSSRKALEQEKSGRKRYLNFLKKTGWQTGGEISAASFAGFPERLAEELMFLCACSQK